jgi:alpha-N-arabinofuranosidase
LNNPELLGSSSANEYFVSTFGDNSNPGTAAAPFRTINHAAQLAMPGDTVTVREGEYREWVRPARGGTSDAMRITYRAAPGEDVRILGSQPAKGWSRIQNGLWKIDLDDSGFDGFNPFSILSRHPEYTKWDTEGDGWGWLRYGKWTHLGDIYLGGEGLIEKQTLDEVRQSPLTWHTRTENGTTTIWANFGDADPNTEAVEINHRPFAFFPEKAGLGYITFEGFTVMNVASHWAPPTVFQPAAIGTNGGHHWVIEDNVVMYAKAVCISIGIPNGQAELPASGYHIIRNNVIMRCGQSGITGAIWNNHSQLIGNHIEDINYREEFGGWETAGIKHHNGDSLRIESNFIRNVYTIASDIGAAHGIWNDYRNSNWRVNGNIVMGAEANAIMAEANWEGPNLYTNNIFVGGNIATSSSRGDAWAHNLFIHTPQIWVNQSHKDRPAIANTRWMNNIFVGNGLDSDIETDNSRYNRNVYLGGAVPHPDDANAVVRPVTEPQVEVIETRKGVILLFSVDEVTRNAGYPIVDNEALDLDFTFDPTVNVDFLGEPRNDQSNGAGPFAELQAGGNEITIYEFPALYWKALSLINEDSH